MKKQETYKLVLAALFGALGILLPTVFHQFGMGGQIFLPMHIPVLLCGLICGWKYGAIIGVMVPLISSFTGMPPLFPVGIAMMFELGTYGFVTGFVGRKTNHFVALFLAMICGRAVSGVANAVLMGIAGNAYGLKMFLTGSFVTALPGIILQIILIPAIMVLLTKTHVLEKLK